VKKIEKNIHKIYLIVALVLGIALSVFLPFFNEPDGQWHYVASSNIAGLSNDITIYGETDQWYGDQWAHEKSAYKDGTFFEKYYATPIKRVPISDLPRLNTPISVLSYNYWGHIIPAIGVYIGHSIYPSIGVMITFGRLFSMLIYTIVMFFIIRWIKRGKLLMTAVTLTPVMMNTFSSLSYDGLSYVLAALAVAIATNIVVNKKASKFSILAMLSTSLFSFVAMKTNVLLILLLFPLAILAVLGKGKISKASFKAFFSNKIQRTIFIVLSAILFLLVFFVVAPRYGGVYEIIYRIFINIAYAFPAGGFTITSFVGSPLFNLPIWVTVVWFIIIVLDVCVDEKFVESKLMSYGALGVYLLNGLAVYMTFMTSVPAPNGNDIAGYISGMQGRYFTPFILTFPLFFGNTRYNFQIQQYETMTVVTILFAVISNLLLLFGSLYMLHNM
jgi:uncharacterized membrane protein